MRASIVELRYRMHDVLKALDRNEEVRIVYHGKLKGILRSSTRHAARRIVQHPFFNMRQGRQTVREEMEKLRGGRYRDL
ncbi:MAG: type II toxin-antitoxin system Phd/YefM family antitoxin [Candidatus Omnitrophica bacterium]|nr:type II toxin-antitoxin system Phd/YefM family antitoxin [Candidatus Omnitrophota bacterium]